MCLHSGATFTANAVNTLAVFVATYFMVRFSLTSNESALNISSDWTFQS
jgi:hypothetical protein